MEVNQSVVKFWKSLREISTDFEADAVIALLEGTFILGVQKLGPVIYIRHCYPQLWKLCLDTLNHAATANRCVVILGTPGIGKTHFGYLVLFHLARAGATVVYETCEDKWTRTLFSGDKVVQELWTDFDEVLAQPEMFYVVDGIEPSLCDAKAILVTSPRKKIWHKYSQRNGAKVLFMPVWTEEEIYRCRDLLYSTMPVETVEKRFYKWGGVARYVLRYAKDKAKQKVLKEAIGQADLKLIVSASVESSGVV
uniref:RxLR effector candidate protein n=1 Tax=Hyaloperonospora arabidopsidis (strain Emoy2) TaxID=559515 RepID=M4BYH6_HYAAE